MGPLEPSPFLEIEWAGGRVERYAGGISQVLAEILKKKNSVDSLARMGLKFLVASFESRLNFDFRKEGGAVRDIAVHTDDILGRGVPDALSKTRVLSEYRAWPLGAQEKSRMCEGAGFPDENDSSVELTQGPFPNNLQPVPT